MTNLIINAFKFGRMGVSASERFRKTGQFSLEDIRRSIIGIPGDYIPMEQLVKLLEYLNIIAPIVQSESSPSQSSKVYLMPCVLENVSREELSDYQRIDSYQLLPASLLIRYECGFIPLGIFPATIANLVGQSSLKLIEKGIKKNRVQFRFGTDRDTITLISQPKYYEVSIKRLPITKTPTHEVCHAIRDIIEHALKTVTSRMNYAFSYQHSFECPSHPGRDHLCIVDSEETSPYIMDCLKYPEELRT